MLHHLLQWTSLDEVVDVCRLNTGDFVTPRQKSISVKTALHYIRSSFLG